MKTYNIAPYAPRPQYCYTPFTGVEKTQLTNKEIRKGLKELNKTWRKR